MEKGKTKKEIKQIPEQQGIEISVSKAVHTIRTAAIACMSGDQIAAHKKAQTFTKARAKAEKRITQDYCVERFLFKKTD